MKSKTAGNHEQLKTEEEYRERLKQRADQLFKEQHQTAGNLINSFLIIEPFDIELADLFYKSEYLENFTNESLDICKSLMEDHAEIEWYMLLGKAFDEKSEVQEYHSLIRECFENSMDPVKLQSVLEESISASDFRKYIQNVKMSQTVTETSAYDDTEYRYLKIGELTDQKEVLHFLREENSYLHDLVERNLQEEKSLRNKVHSLFEENMQLKRNLFDVHANFIELRSKIMEKEYKICNEVEKCENSEIEIHEDLKRTSIAEDQETTAPDVKMEECPMDEFNEKTQVEQENLIKIAMLEKGLPKDGVQIVNKALMADSEELSRYDLYHLIQANPSLTELLNLCGKA